MVGMVSWRYYIKPLQSAVPDTNKYEQTAWIKRFFKNVYYSRRITEHCVYKEKRNFYLFNDALNGYMVLDMIMLKER